MNGISIRVTCTSNSMKSAPDLEAVTNERTVFSCM